MYNLVATSSCIFRWNKSEQTIVTFTPNNKTVQGKGEFIGIIGINSDSYTGTCSMSYLKIEGSGNISFRNTSSLGDLSSIFRIWLTNFSGWYGIEGSTTPTQNSELKEVYITGSQHNSGNVGLLFNTVNNSYRHRFNRCWAENGYIFKFEMAIAGPAIQEVINSVVLNCFQGRSIQTNSGKTHKVCDSYFVTTGREAATVQLGGTVSGASAGTYYISRNVLYQGNVVASSVSNSATARLLFNDFSNKGMYEFHCFSPSSPSFTTFTSDNDYISGMNNAFAENIDTSTGTSSTASPQQYINLTATRTNVKTIRNRPYTMDNIVVGTPDEDSVVITFDCTNGAVSGQGSTTVNSDSASGQAVLNVASVTGFEVGEIIEINYGGARAETGEISSIGASSLTLTANLTYTHTAVQADTVKKQLRHMGLPFVMYGTTSGEYTMQTALPSQEDWGLVYCNIVNTYQGKTYAWNRTGHSVTLSNLEAKTIYYAMPGYYTPDGTRVLGAEQSFATDPEVATDYFSIEASWSLNDSNNFIASFWLEKNGVAVTALLGNGSYTVYDYAEAAVSGLTESGISANSDGVYKTTPVSGTSLFVATHFRMKVSIVYNTVTYTGYVELSNQMAVVNATTRQTKAFLLTGHNRTIA